MGYFMKKIGLVGVWLVILSSIGWGAGLVAQDTADTGPTSVTLDDLGLTGTNVMAFGSLTDPQLEALVNILDASPTLTPDELPQNGTFWSLKNPDQPPFPGDISGANAWQLQDGSFLLNDKTVSGSVVSEAVAESTATALTASSSSPPTPGSGSNTNNSTNLPALKGTGVNYGTNLYLAQGMVTNGYLTAIASNTIPGITYTIQWETNLLPSNWQNTTTIVGSTLTNWTVWSIPQGSWSNLFVRLRSEISSDGSGIPDWWQKLYFATNTVNPNAQDSAGDGYTIYQKYALGVAPGTWLTPPAPSGFSVAYNYIKGTVALNWNQAQGNLQGYQVQRYDPNTDYTTFFNLPTNATSMVDSSPITTFPPENGVPTYGLVANYSNGVSGYVNLPMFDPNTTVSAQITTVAQGGGQLSVQGLIPSGTTAFILTCSDYNWDHSTYSETTHSLPISSLNNNSALLTASWFNSSKITNLREDWYVQTVNASGDMSGMTKADYLVWSNNIQVTPPPFYDGRQQMAQNADFQLRVANDFESFAYNNSADYVYAGLYDVNYISSPYCNIPDYGNPNPTFDAFRPFVENYFYHNFVFSVNDLDPATGFLTTGLGLYVDWEPTGVLQGPDEPYSYVTMSATPTYQFELANTNSTTIPAILDPSQAPWICCYPQSETDVDWPYQDAPSNDGVNDANNNYSMATISSNLFGLEFLSTRFTYNTNGSLQTPILNAYGTIPAVPSGGMYSQTAIPQLKTLDYYFAQPQSYLLPGENNFSTDFPDNTNDLVAGFGQTNLFAGYAKQELLNGYSGVYSYLGQYFQNAYQISANGNVTTNSAGTITPYGVFIPTAVGPAALVTMTNWGENVHGTGLVQVVKLVLDVNHDGTMDLSFNGPDNTSPSSPYQFWCNNNFDRWATNNAHAFTDVEQDDQQTAFSPLTPETPTPDCNYSNVLADGYAYRAIPCTRDLEDFARLWVCGLTTNLLFAMPSLNVVTLSWDDVDTTNLANPTIDIFAAADTTGGIGYQTNETLATTQMNGVQGPYVGQLGPGQSIQISSFDNNGNPTWLGNYFIWCGVSNGTGGLTLTIFDANNNVLAKTKTYIKIQDIKQMYERWTVGDNAHVTPTATAALATDIPTNSMTDPFQYPAPSYTNTPYILHVHGYNLTMFEKNATADTEFKRLYWQGYQGRFGLFRWPTTEQGLGNLATAFNLSEANAWASGAGLLNILTNLDKTYGAGNVYLTAHSHGNVVAGEALRQATQKGLGAVVNTYVAMQGAVDSHTYDTNAPVRPNTTFSTPDRYGQYYTNGAPCYFHGVAGAGTYVNFYNTNDWALTQLWPVNQSLKPASGYGYSSMLDLFYEGSAIDNGTPLPFPGDTYTVFSYCDEAEASALGSQPNVGGAFLNVAGYHQINLPSVWPTDPTGQNYGAHVWHSAEFRSDNPQRRLFWDMVLYQIGIKKSL